MTDAPRHPPIRLLLVGWGSIAQSVARLLRERNAPVVLAAIARRRWGAGVADVPPGVSVIHEPWELGPCEVDLVVEAASAAAVGPWGQAAFGAGADFAPVSVSAFTDDDDYSSLASAAEAAERRLIIPNGAIGGIDILKAAAVFPLRHVTHIIAKPPAAWRGTEASRYVDLDAINEPTEYLCGSVREVAALFPQNANATVTTALAGLGLDQTTVRLVADPTINRNRHVIDIEGDAGQFQVILTNEPMADNPKTSALTALSVVAMVEDYAANRIARSRSPGW